MAWELTGGVGGPGVPTVPGAARHLTPIRHWVAFDDGELTAAWATLQAPLTMFGDLFLPYAPFPPTVKPDPAEPGTVYSWALNNIWDTNFPAQQQGETTFQYAITSRAGAEPRALGADAAAGLTDPLLAVPVTGGAEARPRRPPAGWCRGRPPAGPGRRDSARPGAATTWSSTSRRPRPRRRPCELRRARRDRGRGWAPASNATAGRWTCGREPCACRCRRAASSPSRSTASWRPG